MIKLIFSLASGLYSGREAYLTMPLDLSENTDIDVKVIAC
jgi:hypothetical protein